MRWAKAFFSCYKLDIGTSRKDQTNRISFMIDRICETMTYFGVTHHCEPMKTFRQFLLYMPDSLYSQTVHCIHFTSVSWPWKHFVLQVGNDERVNEWVLMIVPKVCWNPQAYKIRECFLLRLHLLLCKYLLLTFLSACIQAVRAYRLWWNLTFLSHFSS